MMNSNNRGQFVLGVLFGGLLGGAAALLMAPQSGEETQKMVLNKGDELRREAEKRFDDGRSLTRGKLAEARNSVAAWLSAGSDLLEQKSQEIKLEGAS